MRVTTPAALGHELIEADSRRELQRVVALGRYELVVLDELGYLALPPGAAELVFQVISERDRAGVADRDPEPAVRRVVFRRLLRRRDEVQGADPE